MTSRPIKEKVAVHIKNNRAGELVFRTTADRLARARQRHPEVSSRIDVCLDWDLDNFDRSMERAEVMMTWDLPTDGLQQRAPRLKWIHVIGAGVEHLAPFDWLPPGMTVTRNSGIHLEKTREYVGMGLQMLNYHVPKFTSDQRRRDWKPVYSTPIKGKTVTVVGVGKMGEASAQVAKSMGLRVRGVRRTGRPSRYVHAMYTPEDLDAALDNADFVILNMPLTPETENLIGEKQFAALRPGAGLINLARGGVLDHVALASALDRGILGGAILDVTTPEPLPPDSKLWHTPNLIITPHVSSDDDANYTDLTLDLLFRNLGRYLEGRPLINRVRPKLGY